MSPVCRTAWPMPRGPVFEARDVPARNEGIFGQHRAVEELEPIAGRVLRDRQVGDEPSAGQIAAATSDLDAGIRKTRAKPVQRCSVRHFPAQVCQGIAGLRGHDQPLLPVIHAERHLAGATIDRLHAQLASGIVRPVRQSVGANAQIAKCRDHEPEPARCGAACPPVSEPHAAPQPPAARSRSCRRGSMLCSLAVRISRTQLDHGEAS